MSVVVAIASSSGAAAAPVVLSGSFGAGMVGTRPVSIAAAELDVERGSFSLGIGAELRLDGDQLVEGDWDELRDGARLLRYLLWRPRLGSTAALSVAAGRLDGVSVGSGAVVDGFTAGVDLDRHRLGLDVRLATAGSRAHLFVDDVIDPEIGAVRAAGDAIGPLAIGATAAGDRGAAGGPIGSLSVDAVAGFGGERARGEIQLDAVRIWGWGSGLHLGLAGSIGRDHRLGLRVEGHAGTAGYVAGWIGPLHIRDRLEMRPPTGAGAGGHVEIEGAHAGLGSARVRVEHLVGRGRGARLELRSTRIRTVQAGVWAAASDRASALGAELRLAFPRSLFSRLEARRQYSTRGDTPAPLWAIAATFGATIGD
jgi:hypothetical protein